MSDQEQNDHDAVIDVTRTEPTPEPSSGDGSGTAAPGGRRGDRPGGDSPGPGRWIADVVRWLWTRRSVISVAVLLVALMLVTTFAGTQPIVVAASLVAVLAAGCGYSWLRDDDRRDRSNSAWRGRVLLAAAGTIAGAAVVGLASTNDAFDRFGYAGLAVAIVGLSGLISELRHEVSRPAAPVLLVAAVLASGFAFAISFWGGVWWTAGLAVASIVLTGAALEVGLGSVIDGRKPGQIQESLKLRWSVWWLAAAGGALLAGAGAAMWLLWHLSWLLVAYVLLVSLVVGLLVLADNDGIAIAVIIGIALMWAAVPRDTQDASPVPSDAEPYVLAIGDSYLSGEGAPRFITGTNSTRADGQGTNQCRQARTAWPFLLADRVDDPEIVPEGLVTMACSGSVSENLLGRERTKGGDDRRHGPDQLGLFDALGLDHDPALVLVQIGGNDAGFSKVGIHCVAPGSCAEVGDQFLLGIPNPELDEDEGPLWEPPEPLEHIADDLRRAYKKITRRFPEARRVAVAYPLPLAHRDECDAVLLDTRERAFVNAFAMELNNVIEAVAAEKGFEFLDTTETALLDPVDGDPSALCAGGDEAGLNFVKWHPVDGSVLELINPRLWTHNNLHPNPAGHRALAAGAAEWFRSHPPTVDDAPGGSGPEQGARSESGGASPFAVRSLADIAASDELDAISAELMGSSELLAGVESCEPTDASECLVDGDDGGWLGAEAMAALRRALPSVLVLLVASVLVWTPVIGLVHEKNWTVRSWLRRLFGRIRPGSDGPAAGGPAADDGGDDGNGNDPGGVAVGVGTEGVAPGRS
ncbi:MAG: GDSL-type esterase/lipase family protein [Actinomycetota bacterium]|nr:GDSL-type esterase/lipase family protein [Actinomycetota bacterium]